MEYRNRSIKKTHTSMGDEVLLSTDDSMSVFTLRSFKIRTYYATFLRELGSVIVKTCML